jgi:hypothetical protein
MSKYTTQITLYELMADDFDWNISKSKKSRNGRGYDLQIFDYMGQKLLDEDDIHECAMESYAKACRQFLNFYETAKSRAEALS